MEKKIEEIHRMLRFIIGNSNLKIINKAINEAYKTIPKPGTKGGSPKERQHYRDQMERLRQKMRDSIPDISDIIKD